MVQKEQWHLDLTRLNEVDADANNRLLMKTTQEIRDMHYWIPLKAMVGIFGLRPPGRHLAQHIQVRCAQKH